MSVTELRAKAKELGIKGFSKMKKEELEAAIAAVGSGNSKQVGTINGLAVIVLDGKINGQDPRCFLSSLKGYGMLSPQGVRRRVRKLLYAAGHRNLAAIRI